MSAEHEGETGSRLETDAKAVFDASVAGLDGPTRSRLARARAAAVEAASDPGRARFGIRRAQVLGLAVAAALAVAVVWLPSRAPAPAVGITASVETLDDMDLLLDEEDLELFEELEFYAWLDAQAAAEAGDADGSG